MIIRQYTAVDIPSLAELWSRVFGDPEDYILGFLSLLPKLGTCFAAEENGMLISAAYLLTGAYAVSDSGRTPAAYLYAAATDSRFRGRGAATAVCRAAAEYARSTGCSLLYTLPAEDGLYGWYSRIIGTSNTACTHTTELAAEAGPALRRVGPVEYLSLRREYSRGCSCLEVPLPWVMLLDLLCSCFGGGLFASDGAVCACTAENGRAVVTELLPADRTADAAAAAAVLGAATARIRLPGGPEPYAAYSGDSLPPDMLWNYTFD